MCSPHSEKITEQNRILMMKKKYRNIFFQNRIPVNKFSTTACVMHIYMLEPCHTYRKFPARFHSWAHHVWHCIGWLPWLCVLQVLPLLGTYLCGTMSHSLQPSLWAAAGRWWTKFIPSWPNHTLSNPQNMFPNDVCYHLRQNVLVVDWRRWTVRRRNFRLGLYCNCAVYSHGNRCVQGYMNPCSPTIPDEFIYTCIKL